MDEDAILQAIETEQLTEAEQAANRLWAQRHPLAARSREDEDSEVAASVDRIYRSRAGIL